MPYSTGNTSGERLCQRPYCFEFRRKRDLQAPPFPFGALVVVFLNVDVIPASTFRALSGTHTLVQ